MQAATIIPARGQGVADQELMEIRVADLHIIIILQIIITLQTGHPGHLFIQTVREMYTSVPSLIATGSNGRTGPGLQLIIQDRRFRTSTVSRLIVPAVKCVLKIFKESLQVPHQVAIDLLRPVAEGVVVQDQMVAVAAAVDLIRPPAGAGVVAPDQGVADGPDKYLR